LILILPSLSRVTQLVLKLLKGEGERANTDRRGDVLNEQSRVFLAANKMDKSRTKNLNRIAEKLRMQPPWKRWKRMTFSTLKKTF